MLIKNDDTIIIVHPFTSEKILYSTIKNRDYKIITLITPFDSNWVAHCKDTIDKFSDHVMSVDAVAKTDIIKIENLCKHNNLHIVAVINAFDSSLEYADTLAKHFTNTDLDLKFSSIRCNKFLVNQALADAKMSHIKSILIDNKILFKDRVQELKTFNFPVVVKPANLSAARNNVMLANDFNELTKVVKNIQQEKNIFTNEIITDIIIQEFIDGEEFFVNAVSEEGKHYISGLFKYKKEDGHFKGAWSLDGSETEITEKLIHYTQKCLDALQIKYGITHNEFIFDKKGNLYLIEINNRLSGAEVPKFSQRCYHSDEVSIFLDLLEKKTCQVFSLQKIYAHACCLAFSNFTNPNATQLDLSKIKSTHEVTVFRSGIVNNSKNKAANLFVKVSAGIWLYNECKKTLDADTNLLFSRENDGTLFI